jgi:hypothetical protein
MDIGPVPFPYAYANGVLAPGVIGLNSVTGLMPIALIFFLLLTCTRWRGWPSRRQAGGRAAWAVTALALSAGGLLGESDVLVFLAGWGVVTVAWALYNRSLSLPAGLKAWWWILAASLLVIAVQGGAWSDVLIGLVQRLLTGAAPVSSTRRSAQLSWPPALVSSHLGVLS